MKIHLLTEGLLERPVGLRLINYCGHEVGNVHNLNGCGNVKEKACKFAPLALSGDGVLVLTDFMDAKSSCVVDALYLYTHGRTMSQNFHLRFAVPELESWLLADAASLGAFLGISSRKIPPNPELEVNPKRALINCARSSRKKSILEGLVPKQGWGGVGRLYVPTLSEFVENTWNIDAAMRRAPSLERCVRRLLAM